MLTTELSIFQHLVIFPFQKNFKTITIQTPIIPRYIQLFNIQLLSSLIHSYFRIHFLCLLYLPCQNYKNDSPCIDIAAYFILNVDIFCWQPLMARGDTVTPNGDDPPDLCTDSGLKAAAAAAVNCH